MSKITEIMSLIEFPAEACEFFEEMYKNISENKENSALLQYVCDLYYEKFNSEELEEKLNELAEKSGYHRFSVDQLMLLLCGVKLYDLYEQKGYSKEMCTHTLRDLTYKMNKCKKIHNIWGNFVLLWYDFFFKLERFAIGRLQYELSTIRFDYKDILKAGDPILSVHIPASGPLLEEDVKASLKAAYEFFGPNYGDKLMLRCNSWMLYPKTAELFAPGSNMRKFYDLFDIIYSEEDKNNHDLWRIFYVPKVEEDYSNLPQETSLQKAIYKYIKDGNYMGNGYGIITYKPE